ncbi:hypothetical protein GCM10010123_20500 [Pilimelia anulata]|uniref:Uncharacterized protein n=1 Tax=Pilimelia anulata TaxID=53371 RepID=A0A8J3FC88_9ACTN|nr:hypothetical protein GCM10010123_20500 [Pilimelia anulata]
MWCAGSRLSRRTSRIEVESWHLDLFAPEEYDEEIQTQASKIADEVLAETGGRLVEPGSVTRVEYDKSTGALRVSEWTGAKHSFQFYSSGLPLFQPVHCRCRRRYSVPVLAVAYTAAVLGVPRQAGSVHIPAIKSKSRLGGGVEDNSTVDRYPYTLDDGGGVVVVLPPGVAIPGTSPAGS